ncbi:MAG TPA: 50S ribosomal protein L29 [Candidatus Sulfomarinibacteraceae bacterium]|nr:50S ribosomal protein L29 [Candidatus Sulfomarinibacteraceae bacterium]
MAHIVEIREMSDDQLQEQLEIAREELFNLRFQKASARLEDTSRVRQVRREIAQMKEVLHKRRLAVDAAASQPEIAEAISDENWQTQTRYIYEDAAWEVVFLDGSGSEIATAMVNLNQKRPRNKKQYERKGSPQLVKSFEVTG